jgi:hypothetical protein
MVALDLPYHTPPLPSRLSLISIPGFHLAGTANPFYPSSMAELQCTLIRHMRLLFSNVTANSLFVSTTYNTPNPLSLPALQVSSFSLSPDQTLCPRRAISSHLQLCNLPLQPQSLCDQRTPLLLKHCYLLCWCSFAGLLCDLERKRQRCQQHAPKQREGCGGGRIYLRNLRLHLQSSTIPRPRHCDGCDGTCQDYAADFLLLGCVRHCVCPLWSLPEKSVS